MATNFNKSDDNGSIKSNENIPYLIAGDYERTFLMVEFANLVIHRLNVLWNIQGKNGITIKKSDANCVISYDGKGAKQQADEVNPVFASTGSINTGSFEYNCIARYDF